MQDKGLAPVELSRSNFRDTYWSVAQMLAHHSSGGCNLRKGSRLPRECHMHPQLKPTQPSTWELQENGRAFPPNYLHESWRDYLYWDSELES